MRFSKIKNALEYVGGFTSTSKMPCPSYSLPATACKVGAKFRGVKGSVCEKCYAMKGRYAWPVVKNALSRRLESISKDGWEDAMVFAIQKKNLSFFRLHDSGDIQDLAHVKKIVNIAKRCPSCKFWLPTKETAIVKNFINGGGIIPKNLTIRISCPMIDAENSAVKNLSRSLGFCVASVSSNMESVNCHAYKTEGACGKCRKCWDKNIFEIVYKRH